jgi:hypothetical protein
VTLTELNGLFGAFNINDGGAMKLPRMMVGVLTVVFAAGCDDGSTTEPGSETTPGVRLEAGGGIAYSAQGNPSSSDILGSEFAVARADSVGGFAVVSFAPTSADRTKGNLFVLQARRQTGTMACADHTVDTPCHGRYIMGVRNGESVTFEKYYSIKEGTLTVTTLGPNRLKATFSGVLETAGPNPERITVTNGTIDVPYSAEQVTDGTIKCLVSLTGAASGSCRR